MFNLDIFTDKLDKLVRQKKISEKTMEYYISCIDKLETKCAGSDESPAVVIENAIKAVCKDNKQMSKYVAAVKKYEREVLGCSKILFYGEPLERIRLLQPVASQGKKLSHSELTYSHKINGIRDKKLKLAFRLQKKSGLRVDEVASLRPEDIVFSDSDKSIILGVRNGKGRKSRVVNVPPDEYLFNMLKDRVAELGLGESLFYTAAYLKRKAYEHGMETHDLRRINSRERFREELIEGATRREARSAVARELGHEDPKITSSYLGGAWKGED